MKYIDSHCHLHDDRIINKMPKIVSRAEDSGLKYMVSCATMEENFSATADLAVKYGAVLPCYGIHPWFLDSLTPGWEDRLGRLVSQCASGIGETGLDFIDRGADQGVQLAVFKVHLALANDLGRPINIHIRKAWDALIHILKHHGPLKAGGLVHSYSGSADLVKVLEKYNLYISFSGSVTRPNAKKVVQSLAAVSLDRVLFETDAPDLFPSLDGRPMETRSLLNEPSLLPQIVEIAAQRRGMGFEKLANHGYTNAINLFDPLI